MLFNCKDLQKIWNNQINSVTLHPESVSTICELTQIQFSC